MRRFRILLALGALLLLSPGDTRAERVWVQMPHDALIRRLDHESWRTRARAQRSLVRLIHQGMRIPKASYEKKSLEVQARVGAALRAEAQRRKTGRAPRSRPQFD